MILKPIPLITKISLFVLLLANTGATQNMIQGNITCNYGNRGGSCTIELEGGEYSIDLARENNINWYFNDRILPLVEIEGINIKIPEFEADKLTHFQNCQVTVIERELGTDLYIYLAQCAHPAEVYREIW